ncbi:MAG: hypothetical protein K2K89_06320 [Ruminococcus sp.]|nr:hypothetical protein [Ruminococcus sp.]
MFKNAGSKLKVLAKICFWFTVIIGVILGLAMTKSTNGISLVFIPFAILIGWLSNLMAYAFGELCENVYHIDENVKKVSEK